MYKFLAVEIVSLATIEISPVINFLILGQNPFLELLLILSGCNPLTPMSDQDRITPYSINTISTR